VRKIAIANRKGGVGKTTTAVHIAAALSITDSNVLLIDTDSQGHCSRYFEVDPKYGLAEVVEGDIPAVQGITKIWEGLSLMAGGSQLRGTSRLIAREDALKAPYMMSKALEPLEGTYDVVIIDTGPTMNELTANVLVYAAEVIVPVTMEALAISGLADFLNEVEQYREYTDIDVRYIVPAMYDRRVSQSEALLEQLEQRFGDRVTMPVRYSVNLSEAPGFGKTIFEYDRTGRGSVDYAKVAGLITR